MRGVMVDFDLLKIKAQLESAEVPVTVELREHHINSRIKNRQIRRALNTVVQPEESPEIPPEELSTPESNEDIINDASKGTKNKTKTSA
jgi:hypothetical protein